ncbi:hypothetical protein V1460_15290 [Streptomyces sp. SCSIO 30461]|uniref:hypothetical protein n=1 Tax=Streptomyces sp. SCSIO 30461 TaxID=3118085 RepID=UPI0030D58A46
MSNLDLYRSSRRTHAAKAQFYRWFQLYERLHERSCLVDRVERQLQIFADRFEIEAADGRAITTRDAYRDGVDSYSPTERHAHHVSSVTVTELGTDRLKLDAQATYQRIDASGETTGAQIRYEGELIGSVDFEPLFTRLAMKVAERTQGSEFIDAYPTNRALSVVHRFLYLVDAPEHGVYGFDEILAPDGELDLVLAFREVRDRRELAQWLRESSQLVATGTSQHSVENLHVVSAQDDLYTIGMDFDWHGNTRADDLMTARLRYEWTLQDTGERYCRIVRARSTPLPVTPAAEQGF